ncbi:MAG TPA: iron-sulfur cluster repair di-iron protein [Geobacteraceae bacterium]
MKEQLKDIGEKTIGELVAEDYRVAKVFEQLGIDFCCGGNVALSAACAEKGIHLELVLGEIEEAKSALVERDQNFSAWDLSFLADYIVNNHHSYINETSGKLAAYCDKVASVHGGNHPEVIEIAGLFLSVASELASHLREEEEVLFPAVKRAEGAVKAGGQPEGSDRETINGCIALVHEHEKVGDAIHTIRSLSKDYALPGDACNTFMLTYRMLREFEDDIHKHVHLENNILFPKATRL